MPDFGTPVANQVQTPDFTKTLSGLMGLQQQKQALQSGGLGIQQQQQNLQRGAAETQMTQQSAQQRATIANVDWGKYRDDTGVLSTDKMLGDHDLQKASGDQFMDVLKQGAAIRGQQIQNKQTLVGLNNGLRDQFGSIVGALRTDPDVINDTPQGRQKVHDAITQFGQAGGPDAARVASIYAPIAEHAPPGKLAGGIGAIQLQAMDASRQAAAQAPTLAMVPTQGGTQPYNSNPLAAGGMGPQGAPMVPPNQMATDTSGGTQLVNPAQAISTPINAANGAPPMTRPSGESGSTQGAAEGIRANANQAAHAIPEQQFNANQIIHLADETNTGKGAQIIAGLKGQFAGIPWTSDSASNYNRLGHFMALQTSQLAQASGLGGTDAAHGIAAEQAGTREWTPDAIKSTSRVNRALSTGAGLFNQGVENAIKNSNGNIYAARDFQNKWAGVADVNAMRLYDAIKNKGEDPAGLHETLKDLGGVSKDPSSRYQQTLKRVDAMRSLINGAQ
jgi:hypothetical protein